MNANVSATTMVPADAGATCAITWNVLVWEHEIRRHGRVPRGSCYDVLGSQVTLTLNTHKLTHAHRRPGEGKKAFESGRLLPPELFCHAPEYFVLQHVQLSLFYDSTYSDGALASEDERGEKLRTQRA
jgi:hypothetical protein